MFWLEAAVNFVCGPLMIVVPEACLGDVLGQPMNDATAEACRWFGAMTLAFGSVLLARALSCEDSNTLRLVLEAFLLGDIVYTSAAARWCWRQSKLSTAAGAFIVLFSLALGAARCMALRDIRCAMAASPAQRAAKST